MMTKHPLQWLFKSKNINLTAKQMLLPVFELVQPFQQREQEDHVKLEPEPYTEFWFYYHPIDAGITHDAALLVHPAGIQGWLNMRRMFPVAADQMFGQLLLSGPYDIALGATPRGLTDRQYIADYVDCMQRLTERRRRDTTVARVKGRGIANGRRTEVIVVGDVVTGRSNVGTGTGSPMPPHNRRAHERRLADGRRVPVRECAIHGGREEGTIYKVT